MKTAGLVRRPQSKSSNDLTLDRGGKMAEEGALARAQLETNRPTLNKEDEEG